MHLQITAWQIHCRLKGRVPFSDMASNGSKDMQELGSL
jgi:hypothetical protein